MFTANLRHARLLMTGKEGICEGCLLIFWSMTLLPAFFAKQI